MSNTEQASNTTAYNDNRKARYGSDDTYREDVLARNRAAYRAGAGQGEVKQIPTTLAELRTIGVRRKLVDEPEVKEVTFTAEEAAQVLQVNRPTLWKWQKDGRFPDFNSMAVVERTVKGEFVRRTDTPVFTLLTMQRLAQVMNLHMQEYRYYRDVHLGTRENLYKCLE